jgi:hypothetical protein
MSFKKPKFKFYKPSPVKDIDIDVNVVTQTNIANVVGSAFVNVWQKNDNDID